MQQKCTYCQSTMALFRSLPGQDKIRTRMLKGLLLYPDARRVYMQLKKLPRVCKPQATNRTKFSSLSLVGHNSGKQQPISLQPALSQSTKNAIFAVSVDTHISYEVIKFIGNLALALICRPSGVCIKHYRS